MLPILNWCDIQWGLKCVTHMKVAHYWTKSGHSTHKEYSSFRTNNNDSQSMINHTHQRMTYQWETQAIVSECQWYSQSDLVSPWLPKTTTTWPTNQSSQRELEDIEKLNPADQVWNCCSRTYERLFRDNQWWCRTGRTGSRWTLAESALRHTRPPSRRSPPPGHLGHLSYVDHLVVMVITMMTMMT